MAKSKWDTVKDKLLLVEKWARDGLTEEQIAKNLGISRSTLSTYKNEHQDFLDALKKGKDICITEVENALYKRALGYEYEEIRTYIKQGTDGQTTYTEKTLKHQPPDVGACAIILKNKDKDNWMNDPHKVEVDRKLLELRQQIESVKVW